MEATVPLLFLIAPLAGGCANEAGFSGESRVPGEPVTLATRILNAGAACLQNKPPTVASNTYLDGFYCHTGAIGSQMEAHHYCRNLNEEVIQCVIFDGREPSARMTRLKYIIGARLLAQLPAAEKLLWHSDVHEVKSGQLVVPDISEAVERQFMKRLLRLGIHGAKTALAMHGSVLRTHESTVAPTDRLRRPKRIRQSVLPQKHRPSCPPGRLSL